MRDTANGSTKCTGDAHRASGGEHLGVTRLIGVDASEAANKMTQLVSDD